jgi:hypothetical protein
METSYMLEGAGYNGIDPEIIAAHDIVFYAYMWSGGDDDEFAGKGGALIDILRSRRPEMLALEEKAKADSTDAGKRVLQLLHFGRHCILLWYALSR